MLAALGAMFCWGIGDFLIQRTTRKIGDVEALALIGIVGAAGMLPFVVQELPLLFESQNIILLLFLGLITFITAMFCFEGLKKGKLSVVDVIIELELPITIILAFIFLNEVISLPQMIIISFVFIGIILTSIRSFSHMHYFRKIEKGVLYVAIGAIGLAIMNLLTAVGSKQVSPLLVIWVPWIVFTIPCLFVIWLRKGVSNFFRDTLRFKKLVVAMGFFNTIAWIFFATALLKNELAITAAISESYPAIAVFLGVVINKEKILIHQYAGAVIALVSSFLLALFV